MVHFFPPFYQNVSLLEEGPLSDTTASAPGSDDEVGSNAATDGSTLRTSPAEHAGSAGSESGGSAVDSVSSNVIFFCLKLFCTFSTHFILTLMNKTIHSLYFD